MGYSNIIDSLVDNRSVISESGLLRDNKQILRKIEKQLHFFKEAFLIGGVSSNLFFIDWFINNRRKYSGYFGLRLRISDTMYKWIEDENSLYYCIDLNALLSYNNIKYFILGGKLEDSLYTALEDDIESFCDILFDNGSGLSLEELVSFINGVDIPCTYNSWNAARNDIMTKNKLIGVLTRMVNTQLPEYINACLSVDNAYVRLLNGSKDNLFYKNGHVAVARVDIKEDRVVFPQYGNLEICSIHGSAKKERVVYHTISGELLRNTMNSITSSLNNTNLEAINRMLHFYGITDMNYESMQWLINDTHVYKAFETKLEEEVVIKSEKALQDFFDGVILNNTIKGRLFNNTKLPLMRYDTKSQKVYVPNRGDIVFVDFMSSTGDGKDGSDIFSVDDFLSGRINLKDNDLLHIVTINDYDIPLGGAF